MQVENSKMIYRGADELARVYRGDHVIVWEPGEPHDYSSDYLTFKNVGTNTGEFVFRQPYGVSNIDIEISKNGATWIHYSAATVSDRTINRGETISVKGVSSTYTNVSSFSEDRYSSMFISGGTAYHIFGNIMSLIYCDNFTGQTRLTSEQTFSHLFGGHNCTNAKNLILPATTITAGCYKFLLSSTSIRTAPALPATRLAEDCYYNMFNGCTSLVNAPELPATRLAEECYAYMFSNCSSLDNAPSVLPATTLEIECYDGMFNGCTSLVNAPVISATSLASYCCVGMFRYCSSLVNAPALPAMSANTQCYAAMFYGCTSLVNAPVLPATRLAGECYSSMFYGCTSLVNAPDLPATTMMDMCYANMFNGCTSLLTAPVLPSTVLATWSYQQMFSGCTSLNYIKCLATDISATNCTIDWVSGVAPTGTFVKSPDMNDWPSGKDGIPSGWAIIDAT